MAEETIDARRSRVRAMVSTIRNLPTLPAVLARLSELIADPEATAKDVAEVISSDPAISASLLRIVNSPFYGLPNRVSTISHAIVILGFNTVRSVVLSTSIVKTFGGKGKAPSTLNREQFWIHSIGCAAGCRVLARHVGDMAMQEEYFMAGLLHDIGKIVEDQYFHADFAAIEKDVLARDVLIREAEEARLGVDHADVGALLFETWQLAPGIIEAVRCHHRPEQAGDALRPAAIVHMGDICARSLMVGSGGDRQIPRIDRTAWEALGLTDTSIKPLLSAIDEEIGRASVFAEIIQGH